MRDYLKEFGNANPSVRKFEMGGAPMGGPPAGGGAPVAGGMPPSPDAATPPPAPGGPEQIDAMLMQYGQSRDPQLAVQICDTMLQMQPPAQDPAAQGGAPMGQPGLPSGPEAATIPMARNGGTIPVFKKGGSLPAGKTTIPSFQKKAKGPVGVKGNPKNR